MFNLFNINFSPKFFNPSFEELSLLNKFICFNQGKYIQFEYLVGLNHKEMKKEITKDQPDKNRVEESLKALEKFALNEKKEISKRNFDFIIEYFNLGRRSKFSPRICIKGVTPEREISDFIRDHRITGMKKTPIESNTGFKHVSDNGTYYLCQNIPVSATVGTYINPRLMDGFVRSFSPKFLFKFKRDKIDLDWCRCWDVEPDSKNHLHWEYSCYKSTLIIPMTLINNELSDTFKTSFFKNNPLDNRTIWGFLCIDHPTINYFDEEKDIKMGYIFADILSLYFISTYIHTEASESYLKAARFISEG